ncbi:hypothetical protein ABB37_08934 [Leptomonas pyrrhocoris]|uniref:Uncharacterized protein n=1 Tax=Leptomonas pyrrhocoris TaxID=157538 RepID=A0A0M9FSA9_LEPPY|nr:hypothetical protein ABB37_08934 [Leptomonas pyrrhocoris]XP_015653407.1 hypothetical protein ABB37_08934 [Leptomonas pyrrhocoris]KPA74967.1 hypothetical protein ABB37_08934 [Leptomonas pyrrhocoris]KPA74968.1 hypothetical protein ABB37_08934 [Leptomonas pyrrhocoris]|eukprot:XP_015653406.1 hypothetical protein ABB37_08934 [Leptomonas pyrrhocoris]
MRTLPDLHGRVNAQASSIFSLTSATHASATQPAASAVPPPHTQEVTGASSHSADSSIYLTTPAASSTSSLSASSPSNSARDTASTSLRRPTLRPSAVECAPATNSASGKEGKPHEKSGAQSCPNSRGEVEAALPAAAGEYEGICASAQRDGSDQHALSVGSSNEERRADRASPPPATRLFWFNGQLMRVESARHRGGGGRAATPVIPADAVRSVWVGLDRFRVPCRCAGASDAGHDATGCPSALLQVSDTATSNAMQYETDAEVVSSSSSSARSLHDASDQQWQRAVEAAVAAHISAEARRQLFRDADSATGGENSFPDPPLMCGEGIGEEREALLRWWWSSLHH